MKIAYILPKLSNTGPIIVVKDIIDNIKDKVDLIDVYYFDEIRELDFECNLIKINFFYKIDFDNYDVIHSHMLRPDLYVWFHKKKKYFNTLFISTLHQNIFDNLKGNYNYIIALVFERIWLYILKKQDIVITLTNELKKFYEKKVNLNINTIYNGRNLNNTNNEIELNDLEFINNIKSNYKIIGSHCLLTKRKGIQQIIRSLVFLEDYALIIIGNGQELDNLKKISEDLSVSDRCFFIGYKQNAVSFLKYFDLYVMSSYSEGFPLGLLEAGLNKLPIVCSDIPIFRELFTEKEVCFFELDNISNLAKSVELCFANKEQLSRAIYHLINEKYSVKKMVNKYMELYYSKL